MQRQILSLYRSILKLHNQKLPYEMKQIGDKYVKSEFRAIQKAKKETQWEYYRNVLTNQKEVRGVKIKKDILERLDVEQKAQLSKLREAARQGQTHTSDVNPSNSAP